MVDRGIDLFYDELWQSAKPGAKAWRIADPATLDSGAAAFDFKLKFMQMPKVYLNVLALYFNLRTQNSWTRVDELVKRKKFSSKVGEKFKSYLDLTADVRMRYQFFYERGKGSRFANRRTATGESRELSKRILCSDGG